MNKKCTFNKSERISLQREINILFEQGESFISYPLRIIFIKQKPFSGATASVLISVPKKKIKSAVKRNNIKRLIREAYRLNKDCLIRYLQEKESGLLVTFIFIGNEICKQDEIKAAIQKGLNLLIEKTECQ